MNIAEDSLHRLHAYCRNQNWVGYDPFDGLNSSIFQTFPFFRNNGIIRLIFIQFNKKSAVNFRPIFRIEKGRNPKGTGLFLCALVNLFKMQKKQEYIDLIGQFFRWLENDVSLGYSGSCWGYNFDWQSRAFFLPKGTPTVVNTSFIGRAFMNAYDVLGDEKYLRAGLSACNFILNDLQMTEEKNGIGFSYSPIDSYFVNNATALAASLLSWGYNKTKQRYLGGMAKKSMQFVINHQKADGSWNYGEDETGISVGIDNFHTGFILESIKIYTSMTDDYDYVDNMKKGLNFYQRNFFLKNGAPKYFHNRIYPLDIHSAAQAIITLSQLRDYGADMEICRKVLIWMIKNMQAKEGGFYYQKKRFYMNKIHYIRWAQAWAMLALTYYLLLEE